jgi:hypothetical protein
MVKPPQTTDGKFTEMADYNLNTLE